MMFPETQRQVEQKLEHVYGFKRKPSTNGDKLRGRCPDCNHKEASAWAFAEEPWIVFCPRKNECGHENHIRDLFPELFEKWEKRFEPTPQDPLRTVNAYLVEERGFPLEQLKGLYAQESITRYKPKKTTSITLRFPITDEKGNEGWWQRILDQQDVLPKTSFKEDWSSTGHAWLTPNTNYFESKEIWITEGIFDTIALWFSGITSFSALTSNNYPIIFLTELVQECEKTGKPLPKLVWAFDNDEAGHKGIFKNIELAKAAGFECEVALPPGGRKKQDWNDLYKQDRLKFTDLETYKYYGALLVAEKAVDKGILIYKHKGMKSFPFDFNNQVFWFKLDMDKYDDYMKGLNSPDDNEDWAQEEKDLLIAERRDSALEHASTVEIMMECRPYGLYYQYQKEIDEASYFFKVDFPRGGQTIKNTFTSSQITSAGSFGERLTHIAPGVFYEGNSKQLLAFLKRELRDIKRVELINYVGYHKEHQTYVLCDIAVQNGRRFAINKEEYFELPRKINLKARAPFQLEINNNASDYTDAWVKDLLDAYDVRGMVALTAFFGSLFAQQIRSMHKSFPFVELVGEPGTGKSTLLSFLWKLFGRSNYEGIDPSKSSISGLLRTFRQVSNLPVVLLESDREGDKGTVKQFDWNALKTLYDNGSLGAKGVKNGGNETYEPPFMGTLIISQNAEIVSTEAVMGRIVQYKFLKEQMSKKGLYASRNLERFEQSELSQFILLCVEKEKAVLEAYRLGMEKYDEVLHNEKYNIKSSRVIHNHAQMLSLFDALCTYILKDLVPEDIQQKVRSELFEMAQNRDKVLKSDPIIVQNFWNTVEEMEDSIKNPTHETVLNHSAKSDLFAINFAHLYKVAADYRYPLPDVNELQNALRHSLHYRFVEANKAIQSKISSTTKRCWIFEKPTSQRD
ncbi:toprim domain-containing protein [Acinetobacter baumannii]|uniref:toprim domain-containing protein n=1 Tax=Acinetobacter baumannii TaxID=470 RepID=UPI0022217073|nr:toprim domain-containing protein [Acinetobacter baumannii]MCW1388150.1 toprim domain-containing protein [Acinetobacter baumannii]